MSFQFYTTNLDEELKTCEHQFIPIDVWNEELEQSFAEQSISVINDTQIGLIEEMSTV